MVGSLFAARKAARQRQSGWDRASLGPWPERCWQGRPRGQLAALAFSPDGSTLAGASLDGAVCEWEPRSCHLLRKLEAPPVALPPGQAAQNDDHWFGSVGSVAYSPD